MVRFLIVPIVVLAMCSGSLAGLAQNAQTPSEQKQLAKRDDKLTALFSALKVAKNVGEARQITVQIWALWYQSGNGDVDYVMRQARTTFRSGQHEAALGLVDQALQIKLRYSEAWNLRATILFTQGRDAESVADIERTLALEPRHFGALSGMVMINVRLRNWEGALKALEAGLKIHPFLQERKFLERLRELAKGKPL